MNSSSMKSLLSLLDVVNLFNASHQYIPLCSSYESFLSTIPADVPYLSGFEYHLSSVSQPCDALVCFLTRDLQRFSTTVLVDEADSTHLNQAHRASQLLLQSPNLLCVTDHVWFELDAYPDQALSLFVGNHSNIQSAAERHSILLESKKLTHQWLSSLSTNPVPLFDFNSSLTKLFSIVPDWLIAEVGIMDRNSAKAHIKLLLNPPRSYTFSAFLDLYSQLFPHAVSYLSTLRGSAFVDLLEQFDCHFQLSLAVFKDRMIGAIEVLPSFNASASREYDDFFRSVMSSCSALLGCSDLNDQVDCQTVFVDAQGHSFSSRMHHLKLSPAGDGRWIPKVYRDLRDAE